MNTYLELLSILLSSECVSELICATVIACVKAFLGFLLLRFLVFYPVHKGTTLQFIRL